MLTIKRDTMYNNETYKENYITVYSPRSEPYLLVYTMGFYVLTRFLANCTKVHNWTFLFNLKHIEKTWN